MSQNLSQEQQIVAAIRRIVRAVDLHSRRLVEAHGLTGPQLAVLQEAERLAPASPSDIARAIHLSQGTVTGILHRLANRGLIERFPSERDRRSVVVHVREEGKRLLGSAPSLLQDQFRRRLEGLEEWERLQILATLQRVAMLMDAEAIDSSPYLVTGTMNPEPDAPSAP
jgi:DNA-binding MarR family transcriptional regulator